MVNKTKTHFFWCWLRNPHLECFSFFLFFYFVNSFHQNKFNLFFGFFSCFVFTSLSMKKFLHITFKEKKWLHWRNSRLFEIEVEMVRYFLHQAKTFFSFFCFRKKIERKGLVKVFKGKVDCQQWRHQNGTWGQCCTSTSNHWLLNWIWKFTNKKLILKISVIIFYHVNEPN